MFIPFWLIAIIIIIVASWYEKAQKNEERLNELEDESDDYSSFNEEFDKYSPKINSVKETGHKKFDTTKPQKEHTSLTPEIKNKIKNRKILIIESDDFLREILSKKLKKVGMKFEGFKDAKVDFVDQVANLKPDLISLSMLFPGAHSGIDMLKLLKGDIRTSKIPVLFMTNFTDEKYVKEAKSLGAVEYLITAEVTFDELPEIYSKYL